MKNNSIIFCFVISDVDELVMNKVHANIGSLLQTQGQTGARRGTAGNSSVRLRIRKWEKSGKRDVKKWWLLDTALAVV